MRVYLRHAVYPIRSFLRNNSSGVFSDDSRLGALTHAARFPTPGWGVSSSPFFSPLPLVDGRREGPAPFAGHWALCFRR